MNMRRFCQFLNLLFASVAAIVAMGCGQGFQAKTAGSRVLLPWPDARGEYKFSEVQIKTLNSPLKVSGPAAEVYWQVGGEQGGGFSGSPAQPHLSRRGSLWLPNDVASMQSLSVYALFERLQLFDQKLGFANRLTWPRQIGIEINIKTNAGDLLNNAIYDLEGDVIAVSKYYSKAEAAGLPTAVNQGILAHEHFHSHFSAAWRIFNKSSKFTLSDGPQTGVINRLVVSGWNEGLADFYAYAYTMDPKFMRYSFQDQTEVRALNGNIVPMMSWAQIKADSRCDEPCRVSPTARGLIYKNGTSLARWLQRWSERLDPVNGAQMLAQEILRLLPEILASASNDIEAKSLSNSFFVTEFLNRQSLPLSQKSCTELRNQLLLMETVATVKGCP